MPAMQRTLGALLAAGALATAGCQQRASLGAVIATGEPLVTSIAVDGDFVYWTRADGTVKKASLDTGVITTLGQQTGAATGNLVFDEATLYWSVDSSLATVPKAGGALQVYPQTGPILALSRDETNLYWTSSDSTGGVVNQARKADFSVQTLATADNPRPIMAGTATLYWGAEQPSTSNVLFQVPVGGGVVSPVLTSGATVSALTQDTANIYWSGTDGSVHLMAHDAGNPQVLASGQSIPSALITDSAHVYWSNTAGQVTAVSISGSDPELLVQGPTQCPLDPGGAPVAIAMDDTYVYWANYCDDAILAMTKL